MNNLRKKCVIYPIVFMLVVLGVVGLSVGINYSSSHGVNVVENTQLLSTTYTAGEYEVTVEAMEHGEIDSLVYDAVLGEVHVKFNLENGYNIEDINVVDVENNVVESYCDKDSFTCVFVIYSNVTLNASFSNKPNVDIYFSSDSGGSATYSLSNYNEEAGTWDLNIQVNLTSGYRIVDINVYFVDAAPITLNLPPETEFKFVIKEDTSISVGVGPTVNISDYVTALECEHGTCSIDKAGLDYYLSINPDEGYILKDIIIKDSNGNVETMIDYEFKYYNNRLRFDDTFFRNEKITVIVEFVEKPYDINLNITGKGSFLWRYNEAAKKLEFQYDTETYDIALSKIKIVDGDGNSVKIKSGWHDWFSWDYNYIDYNSDITINAEFIEAPVVKTDIGDYVFEVCDEFDFECQEENSYSSVNAYFDTNAKTLDFELNASFNLAEDFKNTYVKDILILDKVGNTIQQKTNIYSRSGNIVFSDIYEDVTIKYVLADFSSFSFETNGVSYTTETDDMCAEPPCYNNNFIDAYFFYDESIDDLKFLVKYHMIDNIFVSSILIKDKDGNVIQQQDNIKNKSDTITFDSINEDFVVEFEFYNPPKVTISISNEPTYLQINCPEDDEMCLYMNMYFNASYVSKNGEVIFRVSYSMYESYDYFLDSIIIEDANGNELDKKVDLYNTNSNVFDFPDILEEVVVKVNYLNRDQMICDDIYGASNCVKKYEVTLGEMEHGTATFDIYQNYYYTECYVYPNPNKGYTVDKVFYTDSYGNINYVSYQEYDGYVLNPDSDITITVTFKKNYIIEDSSYGEVTVEYVDDRAKIYIVPNEGFELANLSIKKSGNDKVEYTEENGYYYYDLDTSKNVLIIANFKAIGGDTILQDIYKMNSKELKKIDMEMLKDYGELMLFYSSLMRVYEPFENGYLTAELDLSKMSEQVISTKLYYYDINGEEKILIDNLAGEILDMLYWEDSIYAIVMNENDSSDTYVNLVQYDKNFNISKEISLIDNISLNYEILLAKFFNMDFLKTIDGLLCSMPFGQSFYDKNLNKVEYSISSEKLKYYYQDFFNMFDGDITKLTSAFNYGNKMIITGNASELEDLTIPYFKVEDIETKEILLEKRFPEYEMLLSVKKINDYYVGIGLNMNSGNNIKSDIIVMDKDGEIIQLIPFDKEVVVSLTGENDTFMFSTLNIETLKLSSKYYYMDYKVNAVEPTGGNLEIISNAGKGQEVTYNVTPNEGYEFKGLKLTDKEGNVTIVNDTTFVMPEGNVTVEAIFEEIKLEEDTKDNELDDTVENPNTGVFLSIVVIFIIGYVIYLLKTSNKIKINKYNV